MGIEVHTRGEIRTYTSVTPSFLSDTPRCLSLDEGGELMSVVKNNDIIGRQPRAARKPTLSSELPWELDSSLPWCYVSWEQVSPGNWYVLGTECKPYIVISRLCEPDFSSIWPTDSLVFTSSSLTDLVDMEVTQMPRYLVTRMEEGVLLECAQDLGHERMYWYRQDPDLGLRLIYFSYDVDSNSEGDIPKGYMVSRKKREHFSLILKSAQTNQTSVYFCASSLSQLCTTTSSPHKKRPCGKEVFLPRGWSCLTAS